MVEGVLTYMYAECSPEVDRCHQGPSVRRLCAAPGTKSAMREVAIGPYCRNISRENWTFLSHEGSVWQKDCGATNS